MTCSVESRALQGTGGPCLQATALFFCDGELNPRGPVQDGTNVGDVIWHKTKQDGTCSLSPLRSPALAPVSSHTLNVAARNMSLARDPLPAIATAACVVPESRATPSQPHVTFGERTGDRAPSAPATVLAKHPLLNLCRCVWLCFRHVADVARHTRGGRAHHGEAGRNEKTLLFLSRERGE